VKTIKDSAMAIDFGLSNLATCFDTNGASFIVDGRKLKSINQWFNKENARLQSIKDLQGIKKLTERQSRLYINRTYQVRDYLNKEEGHLINSDTNGAANIGRKAARALEVSSSQKRLAPVGSPDHGSKTRERDKTSKQNGFA
jgi:transposase